jgi:hypothetical protein
MSSMTRSIDTILTEMEKINGPKTEKGFTDELHELQIPTGQSISELLPYLLPIR